MTLCYYVAMYRTAERFIYQNHLRSFIQRVQAVQVGNALLAHQKLTNFRSCEAAVLQLLQNCGFGF